MKPLPAPVFAVSSLMPFPALSFWAVAVSCGELLLDAAEHFQKMSQRNRYRIAAANGALLCSIPLQGGREQCLPMRDVLIDDARPWAELHWRSLFSAYGRAPFFEHYAPALQDLLLAHPQSLTDFCRMTIDWLAAEMQLKISLRQINTYERHYPDALADLRFKKKAAPQNFPRYAQVFEARNGFLPDLSALDLLMNEGPSGGYWLKTHAPEILAAMQ